MKKIKADKYLTIRIPEELMIKFQESCNKNYKTMSESLRDFIQKYIKENKC